MLAALPSLQNLQNMINGTAQELPMPPAEEAPPAAGGPLADRWSAADMQSR